MRSRLTLLLVVSLAACTGGHAEPPPPRAGVEPILRIDTLVSLAPPGEMWAPPDFVLLADGTAFLRGGGAGEVPVSVERRRLSPAQVDDLYRRAGDADLFTSRTYDRDILDGSALVVAIASAAGRYRTTVVQAGRDDGGRRGRIARFAEAAPRAGAADGAYRADRYAVIVLPPGGDTPDVRPWPLAIPPAELPGWPSRPCLVVDAAAASPLLAATADTRWAYRGEVLTLFARPLLPYERDCAGLRRG